MKIVIRDFFVGGSYYKSSTDQSGLYSYVANKKVRDVILTPEKDFSHSVRSFFNPVCPIIRIRNKIVIIYPLRVETGKSHQEKIVGSASQYINVAGTLEIQTEPGENVGESVSIAMLSDIEGNIEVKAGAGLPPPFARLGVLFSAEKIGELGETIAASGSQTQGANYSIKAGVDVPGSAIPGVGIGLGAEAGKETSVEVTPYGKIHIGGNKIAKVPVNTSLVWRLSLAMEAKNDGKPTSITAAMARLRKGIITFGFIDVHLKNGPSFLPMLIVYVDGRVMLLDPSSLDNRLGIPSTENDFQNIKALLADPANAPRLRHIVQSGQFTQEDRFLNSILSFSGFALRREDSGNEKFYFNDAELNILDSQDPEQVVGHALLTDIVANARQNTFTAQIRQLEIDEYLKSTSQYAKALQEQNGIIHLDADIIRASQSFTQNAISEIPFFGEVTVGQREGTQALAAHAEAEGYEEEERELQVY